MVIAARDARAPHAARFPDGAESSSQAAQVCSLRRRGSARAGSTPPSAGPIVEVVAETPKPAEKPVPAPRVKPPRERIDPQLVAKARELRDRYLEHVNGERVNESPKAMIVPSGKYDVSRRFGGARCTPRVPNAA